MLTVIIKKNVRQEDMPIISDNLFQDLIDASGKCMVLVEYKLLHKSGLAYKNSIGATIIQTQSINKLKEAIGDIVDLKYIQGTDSSVYLSLL